MEISDVYDFYSMCLLDQDDCQILIVLQDAAGSKKKTLQGSISKVTGNNQSPSPLIITR